MNARKLQALSLRLYRLQKSIRLAARSDGPLIVFAEAITDVERKVGALASERELAEAERKDRGEVLWTLYLPRCTDGNFSFWDRCGVITRTPNRITRDVYYSTGKSTYVVSPESAYTDLEREFKQRPLDLDKFRAHAAKVDASWKKARSAGYPEHMPNTTVVGEAA